MGRVRVKVCGIRSLAEAREAVAAGADALGFILAESPRQVTPAQVREITRHLPPLVNRVGVFVEATRDEAEEVARYCGLDTLQLHGTQDMEQWQGCPLALVKALQVRGPEILEQAAALQGKVQAVLLDTYHPERAGGTGRSFDWELAGDLATRQAVIVAGGLTAENVSRAIQVARPFAVDVASGVELNGRKDPALLRAFLQVVRRVEYAGEMA